MNPRPVGLLPAIAAGTLAVFFFLWAALHDIAHASESDYTLEYIVLALSVFAFGFLYRQALRLPPPARIAWLAGAGLVLALFSFGARQAQLQPKYAADPMLGSFFLAAALPVLVLIAYHLVRHLRSPGA